jgi:hypothetical protein
MPCGRCCFDSLPDQQHCMSRTSVPLRENISPPRRWTALCPRPYAFRSPDLHCCFARSTAVALRPYRGPQPCLRPPPRCSWCVNRARAHSEAKTNSNQRAENLGPGLSLAGGKMHGGAQREHPLNPFAFCHRREPLSHIKRMSFDGSYLHRKDVLWGQVWGVAAPHTVMLGMQKERTSCVTFGIKEPEGTTA